MRALTSTLKKSTMMVSMAFFILACGNGEPSSQGGKANASAADTASVSSVKKAEEQPAQKSETQQSSTPPPSTAQHASADIESLYQKTCISCHISGAAGAPRTHDVEAWKPRMAKGMDAMLASIHNGLNAMPPKGMCFDCSDEQYAALVQFMASPKPE